MKILSVVGARPNFIKIASFINAIQRFNQSGKGFIQHILVHTGQHYDIRMSEIFFQELEIPTPDINLEVGAGSHSLQTAEIMKKFDVVLEHQKPDIVVVVGDVNSTLACSLVVAKANIKGVKCFKNGQPALAHIEAGLRSCDRTMPEEINRIITDALADILFTPSLDANENLIKEGIPEQRIKMVGNIMIDTLMANIDKSRLKKTHLSMGLTANDYVYVTLHRPSNVDNKEVLSQIMGAIEQLSLQLPVVFPIHPRTRKKLRECSNLKHSNGRLLMIDPIGYHDSICLTENARFVITDSGGLQEETTFFRTPCLTMRYNTERPVTLSIGSNCLTNSEQLASDITRIMYKPNRFGQVPQLWDGKTSDRIVQVLANIHEEHYTY